MNRPSWNRVTFTLLEVCARPIEFRHRPNFIFSQWVIALPPRADAARDKFNAAQVSRLVAR
jgi:hypothetical protein